MSRNNNLAQTEKEKLYDLWRSGKVSMIDGAINVEEGSSLNSADKALLVDCSLAGMSVNHKLSLFPHCGLDRSDCEEQHSSRCKLMTRAELCRRQIQKEHDNDL